MATGGSGGHLFPALKVALELKKKGHEAFFLGSFGLGVDQIQRNGFEFKNLHARGFGSSNLKENLGSSLSLLKASFMAFSFLREFHPDVVVGFGGYGAFPVVLAAVLLRYPTIIHEQNVTPGKANALLSKFVRKVAISFEESYRYFNQRKTILTGCPCQYSPVTISKEEIYQWFNLKEGKTTILVFGGSQGSHRINQEFLKSVILLKDKFDFQFIHICGKKDFDGLKGSYAKIQIPFALFEFLDRMDYAYRIADLIVGRAGALTVTEIAMHQIPAILIPYPYAGGHQKKNALALREAARVSVIEEKSLTTKQLKEAMEGLLTGEAGAGKKEARFPRNFFPDAAARLAAEAEGLGHEN